MLYENWLRISSKIKTPPCPPLQENIEAEYLVIGGGFAGLHAALTLANAKKNVVLLEKTVCGGSSSGQSGGFLTPESEEDLHKLIDSLGNKKAKKIYEIPLKGVQLIIDTVKKNNFDCDLREQDSLYVSIKKGHNNKIEEEAETRKEMGLPYELIDEKELKKVHPGKKYLIGLKYPGSYGINSFAYTQEMKNLLLKKGVKIYEDSEVHKIEDTKAITHLGSVKAKKIIICMDKLKKEFDADISKKAYHVQTYLAISEPLSKEEIKTIYPKKELMCWDTRWNYAHYRPVAGNRILIGGSSTLTAYHPRYYLSPKVIQRFIDELKENFPVIKSLQFTNYWAGLIDVTKDLVPIVDTDPKNKSITYVMGCAGLNWAAYCGDFVARKLLNPKDTEDFSDFVGINRKFYLTDSFQKIFGKRITFGLSHLREMLK